MNQTYLPCRCQFPLKQTKFPTSKTKASQNLQSERNGKSQDECEREVEKIISDCVGLALAS